jgi:predicted ATPase
VLFESLTIGEEPVYDTMGRDAPIQTEPERIIHARLYQAAANNRQGEDLRFHVNQPVISQLVQHQDVPDHARHLAQATTDALASMRFLDLSPDAMRVASLPGQEVLGDLGENLSSVLQSICEDTNQKQAALEWIRELTPVDVTDFEFVPDQTGRVLVTLIEANGQKTSAYSASDGTLWFLAMIAAMLGGKPARCYFFEELENGIHPTRLHLLLQLIEQEVSQGRTQVIATTHSPQLLSFLSREAQEHAALIYRLEGEPDARIKRILDIPEARRIIDEQDLSRLHGTGWLEDAVAFLEGAPQA